MDVAPLNNAHAFARAAYRASDDHTLATKQHHAAADKFKEAATSSHDLEAVRILKLLEEHHEKLSRIVKSPAEPAEKRSSPQKGEHASDAASKTGKSSSKDIDADVESPRSKTLDDATSATKASAEPTSASMKANRRSSPVAPRRLQRESSSSIANDLATARGIPTVQQRGTRTGTARHARDVHVPGKVREDGAASSSTTGDRAARVSRTTSSQDTKEAAGTAAPLTDTAASEAAFQRFYSTIEGIWSKIPASLAFTGLPLVQEEAEPTSAPPADAVKTTATSTGAGAGGRTDLNKLFSPAALQAARDGSEQGPAVHESFYVVPPGGGTVSYAGMLARERKHARSQSTMSETGDETEEHFVDAQETPQSRSSLSRIARRASSYRSPSTNKTFEELEEENAQLKQLTDELAAKIYEWEKNSQNQYAALHQSMRLMPQQSRETGGDQHQKRASSADHRVKELEEQVRQLQKDVERRAKENEKLSGVVVRYRERWEKLKDSARGRREPGGSTATATAR